MKVQCSKCKSTYNIKDEKIPDNGAKIKCPKCQSVISIMKTAKSSSHSSVQQPVQNDNHINKQAKLNNKKDSKKIVAIMLIVGIGIIALLFQFSSSISWSRYYDEMGQKAAERSLKRQHGLAKASVGEANEEDSSSNFLRFKQMVDTMDNVKWGVSPEKIPNLTINPWENPYSITTYIDEEGIANYFFKNRLFNVAKIFEESGESKNKKIGYLISKFGKGTNKEKGGAKYIVWETEDLTIVFAQNPNKPNISIFSFKHTDILMAKEAYKKQIDSQQTEVASKDTSHERNDIADNSGWKFLKWGMSPEQVVKAFKNNFHDFSKLKERPLKGWPELPGRWPFRLDVNKKYGMEYISIYLDTKIIRSYHVVLEGNIPDGMVHFFNNKLFSRSFLYESVVDTDDKKNKEVIKSLFSKYPDGTYSYIYHEMVKKMVFRYADKSQLVFTWGSSNCCDYELYFYDKKVVDKIHKKMGSIGKEKEMI